MQYGESLQSLSQAATAYAHSGWLVHPLKAGHKEPLTLHGVKDATNDPEVIQEWWSRWPQANIGLAIPHGLLVVDIDSPEALGYLQAKDLHLPTTTWATTRRGRHLWYSTGKTTVRNRVGLFPGVDIRAPGGYVVAPPSIHPSGVVYRWEVKLEPSNIAECPDWLIQRLKTNAEPRGRSADDWYRKIAMPVLKGRRNQSLAEIAGLLFRRHPAKVAAELAVCWAQARLSPPLPECEVRRTIESIAGLELRRRQGGVV